MKYDDNSWVSADSPGHDCSNVRTSHGIGTQFFRRLNTGFGGRSVTIENTRE